MATGLHGWRKPLNIHCYFDNEYAPNKALNRSGNSTAFIKNASVSASPHPVNSRVRHLCFKYSYFERRSV
jgi:hypothetical protein